MLCYESESALLFAVWIGITAKATMSRIENPYKPKNQTAQVLV